jgi:hypothetical protein
VRDPLLAPQVLPRTNPASIQVGICGAIRRASGIGPPFFAFRGCVFLVLRSIEQGEPPVARKVNSQHRTDDAKSPDQVWSSSAHEHVARSIRQSFGGTPARRGACDSPYVVFLRRAAKTHTLAWGDGTNLATGKALPDPAPSPQDTYPDRAGRTAFLLPEFRARVACQVGLSIMSRSAGAHFARARRTSIACGLACGGTGGPADSLAVSRRRNQLRNRFKAILLTQTHQGQRAQRRF